MNLGLGLLSFANFCGDLVILPLHVSVLIIVVSACFYTTKVQDVSKGGLSTYSISLFSVFTSGILNISLGWLYKRLKWSKIWKPVPGIEPATLEYKALISQPARDSRWDTKNMFRPYNLSFTSKVKKRTFISKLNKNEAPSSKNLTLSRWKVERRSCYLAPIYCDEGFNI